MQPQAQHQPYTTLSLSSLLLQHHLQMLQFMHFTPYDIIYQSFELKHAAYSTSRKGGGPSQRFKSEQIARHYEMISEKLHIRIMRDDIELDKQLAKLQTSWHNRNIPYFQRYYFQKYVFTAFLKTIPQSIQVELTQIQAQTHPYFAIFQAINARQSCLRQLKKALAQLGAEDVYEYLHVGKERMNNQKRKDEREKLREKGYKIKVEEVKTEGKLSKTKLEFFSDNFNHLTKLTLYVIELILKWKDYIKSLTHDQRKQRERIQYYFYDDNYFLKILNDMGFLRVSFFSQFYDFAERNDPFMLFPVLSFQKNETKTVEHELLKMIFMPQQEMIALMMVNLQCLSEQYKWNIRSRKTYDIKAIQQPIKANIKKQINNGDLQEEPPANLILKKLESPQIVKKSQSMHHFRIKDQPKEVSKVKFNLRQEDKFQSQLKPKFKFHSKSQLQSQSKPLQTILIQINKGKSLSKRKLTSIPGVIEKIVYDTETSPLKHSVILQKNEHLFKQPSVDPKLLEFLKAEVIRKVREDFNIPSHPSTSKDQALQMYIDGKVHAAMQSIFPYAPEKQLKQPIEFTAEQFLQTTLPSQLDKMFKHTVSRYAQMQSSVSEVLKKVENSQYTYFVAGTQGDQLIGKVVCTQDMEFKEYKVIKVLYTAFADVSQLELMISKFVEFIMEFDNPYEVHFPFLQPAGNQTINQLITTLQKSSILLSLSPLSARKQLYSSITQVLFIFKRQHKNVNHISNSLPTGLYLDLSVILAQKKLMLQTKEKRQGEREVAYEAMVGQVIKRWISSADIVKLKESITWKDKLKRIMQNINNIPINPNPKLKFIQHEAPSISSLNNALTKESQVPLQLSDLSKTNKIHYLSLSLRLSFPYPAKSVYMNNKIQYYRYAIKGNMNVYLGEDLAEGYLLETTVEQIKVLVFQANKYLEAHRYYKAHGKYTNSTEKHTISTEKHTTSTENNSNSKQGDLSLFGYVSSLVGVQPELKHVQHLYFPMSRYPPPSARHQAYLSTQRVPHLQQIGRDLLMGERYEWFCSMLMDNGVKYQQKEGDILLSRDIGIAIINTINNTVLYARIFQ